MCVCVCVHACVFVSVMFWYPWMIPVSRVPAVDTVSRFIRDNTLKVVSGQDFMLYKYFIILRCARCVRACVDVRVRVDVCVRVCACTHAYSSAASVNRMSVVRP